MSAKYTKHLATCLWWMSASVDGMVPGWMLNYRRKCWASFQAIGNGRLKCPKKRGMKRHETTLVGWGPALSGPSWKLKPCWKRKHIVDGWNPAITTWDGAKTRTVDNGINYQPQLVSLPHFWTINSITNFFSLSVITSWIQLEAILQEDTLPVN